MLFPNHRPGIVPKGPWNTSLDWDLCATSQGEMRTPFRHHVHPEQEKSHLSLHSFTQFPRLPLELQHYILSFCDNATLFQLMRASPSTRKEAAKLFWSDPAARYEICGSWLLSGGFPGTTHTDLEALKCIQYALVDFEDLPPILCSEWVDGEPQWISFPSEGLASGYAEHQIAEFWKTLRRRFPCATDVVLSAWYLDDSGELPPSELTQLAEGCPDGVYARATRFRCDNKDQVRPKSRELWQPIHSDNSSVAWELVDPSWTPRIVLPPIQERSGPVGTYLRWLHGWADPYNYMYNARRLLLIQATEAYYLHTLKAPCVCPFARCALQFEQPGQWTSHYVSSDDNLHVLAELPPPPCETLQAAFARQDARLELMRQRFDERLIEMRVEWGEKRSEQREYATQQFLHQLRDDPLCAREKAPEESHIWRDYQIEMNDEWQNWVQ